MAGHVQTRYYPAVAENCIRPAHDESHLLYARGFTLTNQSPPALLGEHWASTEISGWALSWDRRSALAVAQSGVCAVALLGRAVHLTVDSHDLARIAERLAASRAESRTAYLDALGHLAGRYVVIDSDGHSMRVQTDATGMRSVFYAAHGGVVAGHENHVADQISQPSPSLFDVEWFAQHRATTYPGRATSWREVYLLTPNTELDPSTGKLNRVGPGPLPAPLRAESAAELLLEQMRQQIEHLTADGRRLQVSLTAGIDSRITLAALRPYLDRCEFFTYALRFSARHEAVTTDVTTATELAGRFELCHRVIEVNERLRHGPLRNVMSRNSTRKSGQILGAKYREHLPADAIHLRSNLYEIGRAYYHRTHRRRPISPEAMTNILTNGKSLPQEAIEEFQDFASVTALMDVEGYDPYDLFYWEHRMSAWLNTVLIESDIALDTYIPVNSRATLRALLAVPFDDRVTCKTFDDLVQLAWPELYDVPVNGRHRTFA